MRMLLFLLLIGVRQQAAEHSSFESGNSDDNEEEGSGRWPLEDPKDEVLHDAGEDGGDDERIAECAESLRFGEVIVE